MTFTTFQQSLIEALGWTLIHSLWQGIIIAAVLAIAIRFIKNKSPQLIHQLCCYSLLGLIVWMVSTFMNHFQWASPNEVFVGDATDASVTNGTLEVMYNPGWQQKIDAFFQSFIQSYSDELVMVWLLGVILFGIKWGGSLYYTFSLKKTGVSKVSNQLQATLNQLVGKLQIKQKVTILKSSKIDVPMVIGTFKPVILLPASILTGFTSEQIESVIVHELAHIKSNDFLVSLLLSAMEVILFYHPAYWWITGIIMEEREKRCDDIAVQECGNPLLYARTLFSIAEHKQQRSLALSMQGKKHQLFDRIKRVCISQNVRSQSQNNKAGMALGLLFGLAIMALAQVPLEAKEAFIDPVREVLMETFQDHSEESEITGHSHSELPHKNDELDSNEKSVSEILNETDAIPMSSDSIIVLVTQVDQNGNTNILKKDAKGNIHSYIIKRGEGHIYIDNKRLEKGNHQLTFPENTSITFRGTTHILDEDDINESDMEGMMDGDELSTARYLESVNKYLDEKASNDWVEEGDDDESDYEDEEAEMEEEGAHFEEEVAHFEMEQEELEEAMREVEDEAVRELEESLAEIYEEAEMLKLKEMELHEKASEEQKIIMEKLRREHEFRIQEHQKNIELHHKKLEKQHEHMELQQHEMHERMEELRQQQHEEMERQQHELHKHMEEAQQRQHEQLERQQHEMQLHMERANQEQQEALELKREAIEKQHEQMMLEREARREAIERDNERRREEMEMLANKHQAFQEILVDELIEDGLIKNKKKYKIHLRHDKIKVNNKRLSDELHQKYMGLYEEYHGKPFSENSAVKINKH